MVLHVLRIGIYYWIKFVLIGFLHTLNGIDTNIENVASSIRKVFSKWYP